MEIPDELLDSKPSPTNFSQPPFQPINSRISNETSPSPSSYTDPTPILSPMSSTHPDAPSPMTIRRQSIDQNLRKLAKTAAFSDVYRQEYSGYFKDIKDYIYIYKYIYKR